jgi:hypothetical protein
VGDGSAGALRLYLKAQRRAEDSPLYLFTCLPWELCEVDGSEKILACQGDGPCYIRRVAMKKWLVFSLLCSGLGVPGILVRAGEG